MSDVDLVSTREFLPLFPSETEDAIRDRFAAWANEGLDTTAEDEWVDTIEGSFFWIATAPAIREQARAYDTLGTEYVAAGIPFWSWGDYLDDHAAPWEVVRLAATPAAGRVTWFADPGTAIDAGITVAADPLPGDPNPVPREYQTLAGGIVQALLVVPTAPTVSDGGAGGGLATTTSYHYVVTATNSEGETTPSGEGTGTTTGSDLKLALDWPDVPSAVMYRIYRSLVPGGPYDFLDEVTASEYLDDGTLGLDPTRRPPTANTTGNQLTVPVEALLPGSASNAAAGAVTNAYGGPGGATLSNAAPIVGGTDPETDSALLTRLLSAYRGRGPGTQRDYEAWARAFPGVGRATCIPVWSGPGTVLVVVMTAEGDPVSTDVVDALLAYLDPVPTKGAGAAPIGPTVTVQTAGLVNVTVSATVVPEVGFSLDGSGTTTRLFETIVAAIDSYLNSLAPGDTVVLSKVSAAIVDVPGVADVSAVEINGAAANLPLGTDPPEVPNSLPPVLS